MSITWKFYTHVHITDFYRYFILHSDTQKVFDCTMICETRHFLFLLNSTLRLTTVEAWWQEFSMARLKDDVIYCIHYPSLLVRTLTWLCSKYLPGKICIYGVSVCQLGELTLFWSFPLRAFFQSITSFITTKCTYIKYIYLSSFTSYMFRCLLHHLQGDNFITCSKTIYFL